MRFIADRMLGRLAKWLRILGYDTRYDVRLNHPQLLRVARSENRLLLTRDVRLAQHKGVRTLLVASEALDDQLRQVSVTLDLVSDGSFSRCPVCNDPLEETPKDRAWGQVPSYVFVTQERLLFCPSCGRFYWRGTHWERMQRVLAQLGQSQHD